MARDARMVVIAVLALCAATVASQKVCRLRETDFCIMVDGSGSVGDAGFKKERKFVLDFIEAIENSNQPEDIRFSVFVYGTKVWFPKRIPVVAKGNAVRKYFRFFQYFGGFSRPDLALEKCKQIVKKDGRPNANQVAILISDGEASNKGKKIPDSEVLREANALKKAGATVVTIGAGQDVNLAVLEKIATDDKVVSIDKVKSFPKFVDDLIDEVCDDGTRTICCDGKAYTNPPKDCNGVTCQCGNTLCPLKGEKCLTASDCKHPSLYDPKKCVCHFCLNDKKDDQMVDTGCYDLLTNCRAPFGKIGDVCGQIDCSKTNPLCVMVDDSGSLGRRGYQIEVDFVNTLVTTVELANPDVNFAVGMVLFSQSVRAQNKLGTGEDALKFLANNPYEGSLTNTAGALDACKDLMAGTAPDGQGAAGVAVLLSDGHPNRGGNAVSAAQRLKKSGAVVVSVGVGQGIDKSLLRRISTGNLVLQSTDIATLGDIIKDTLLTVCKPI